jgi:hypothetical protein
MAKKLRRNQVNSLTIRRIFVWVASMVIATILGILMIQILLPVLSPDPNAKGVSIQEFGPLYFLTMVIPLGLIFVTWFDYLADTKIWPE